MSASPAADRNLLFAVLALQMNFVSRDDLVAAMNAWALDKVTPLGRILLDRGNLTAAQLQALDALLELNLQAHGGDPQRSLHALRSVPSLSQLFESALAAERGSLVELTVAAPSESTVDYPPPAADRNGARYRVLRPHVKGGLGEVFVAEDTELHREVALKEIQERWADDADSRARFVLEAEVTGGLEHPGIVPVYGLGVYGDGRPYYAMRFIRGVTFRTAIEMFHLAEQPGRDPGERRLALRHLLTRFVGVCNAVAYAHSRGVLHRDIKPSNVMLGKFGETLVVDWGLAKPGADKGPVPAGAEPTLRPGSGGNGDGTRMGSVLGTPPYMSPEQAAGKLDELGPASDIYSLGATLYALLTGLPPFEGNDVSKVLVRVQAGQFPPPRQVKSSVPKALDAVCRKAMALRPADRYTSALDLAADVDHWLADEPVTAYREPAMVRMVRWARRHRTAVVAAGVLLVTAVVALSATTGLVWREQKKTEEAKRKAEEQYSLARDLSASSSDLIAASEVEFAASPAGQAARRKVLKSASDAFRMYLAERPDDPDLRAKAAQVYRYTANVYRFEGDTAAADPLYRESISLYTNLAEQFPEQINHSQLLAHAMRDWSAALQLGGRGGEATDVLRSAVVVAEKVRAAKAGDSDSTYAPALTLLDLSGIEHNRGDIAESGKTAAQAVALFREIVHLPAGRGQQYTPLLLARALNRFAVAERDQGRLDAAQQSHIEASVLLRGIVEKRGGVASQDVLHFQALCLLDEARTWARDGRHLPRAEDCLNAAIKQWEKLAADNKTVATYPQWQASGLQARAQLRAEANRTGEARADLDEARRLLEQRVSKSPQMVSDSAQLGRAYLGLARLDRTAGNHDTAADWFRRADDMIQKAVRLAPDDARSTRLREELRAEQLK